MLNSAPDSAVHDDATDELINVPMKDALARAYSPASAMPTQEGPDGIRFDFNEGARVYLPDQDGGVWRVALSDLDTGNLIYETEIKTGFVRSSKQYCIRFRIDIDRLNDGRAPVPVLSHEYDAYGRTVIIQFPVGTLGDILAWFPYAVRFWQLSGCRLTCVMAPEIAALLAPSYPNIIFVTHGDMVARKLAESAYATYLLGVFFDDPKYVLQPTDFRHVGLHRTAGYVLGVDPAEERAQLVLPDESRPFPNLTSVSRCKVPAAARTGTIQRAGPPLSPSCASADFGSFASTGSPFTVKASSGPISPTGPRTRRATGPWRSGLGGCAMLPPSLA